MEEWNISSYNVDVEKDDDSIKKVTSIFDANFLTPLPCGKFLAPGMRVRHKMCLIYQNV